MSKNSTEDHKQKGISTETKIKVKTLKVIEKWVWILPILYNETKNSVCKSLLFVWLNNRILWPEVPQMTGRYSFWQYEKCGSYLFIYLDYGGELICAWLDLVIQIGMYQLPYLFYFEQPANSHISYGFLLHSVLLQCPKEGLRQQHRFNFPPDLLIYAIN